MNKPVVLVIMDGVGETPVELGNMVMRANTPTLDSLRRAAGSAFRPMVCRKTVKEGCKNICW